ncbi:hypothetical protein UlMin_006679 [Ulmus minor]
MEVGENPLYLHLRKLSGVKSSEVLDQLISTLWKTRKTGLRGHHDKSHFHSLLNLPSLSDLDLVLACLRSLVRKCAYEDVSGDDIHKLFPPDLPPDLRSILVVLFQKYQSQWKEDLSKEQHSLPRASVSYNVKTGATPAFTSFSSSNISAALWPRQDDSAAQITQNDDGPATPGIVPQLKSMTWTMDNSTLDSSKRVAVITLKLQDYSNSPSETQVKFQLTRDTVEDMLTSMTSISEKLSAMVGTYLEPMQKKQKQSSVRPA